MAENPGKYPLDPTSKVGQVRVTLGDTASEPFDPPRPGEQNYGLYSDLEIEGFLAVAEDSVDGALYGIYMQMAGAASRDAKNVQDMDLRVNTEKRAEYLLRMAQQFKDAWTQSTADIFEVFDLGGSDFGCVPELAPRTVCRRGCNGSELF